MAANCLLGLGPALLHSGAPMLEVFLARKPRVSAKRISLLLKWKLMVPWDSPARWVTEVKVVSENPSSAIDAMVASISWRRRTSRFSVLLLRSIVGGYRHQCCPPNSVVPCFNPFEWPQKQSGLCPTRTIECSLQLSQTGEPGVSACS